MIWTVWKRSSEGVDHRLGLWECLFRELNGGDKWKNWLGPRTEDEHARWIKGLELGMECRGVWWAEMFGSGAGLYDDLGDGVRLTLGVKSGDFSFVFG